MIWRHDWPWIVGLAALLALVLGVALWDAATCLEYGPAHTEYMWQTCGNGCSYMVPMDVRDCVRRR